MRQNNATGVADLLLRGSLSEEQFESVQQRACEENLGRLLACGPIAAVTFCVLLALSTMANDLVAANMSIYTGSCLAMGIVSLITYFFAQQHNRLVLWLTYAFMAVLYLFSIWVSLAHTALPAVSEVVFLMVAPLLFVDRPVRVVLTTVVVALAECHAAWQYKPPHIAEDDLWNILTYGAVAVVVNIFVMRLKYVALYQAVEIAQLSEFDVLTGLRNRNSYENRLESYPREYSGELVCLFADADGLHEVNNTQGHDAGDALIVDIATEMLQCFGKEHTYRIGGDEFVSFWPGGSVNEARHRLSDMRDRLATRGHYVSCGASSVDAAHANMRSLVRAAEKEMYKQKFSPDNRRSG